MIGDYNLYSSLEFGGFLGVNKLIMDVKKDNAVIRYLKDSFAELSHVTWPTRNQAINLSILVVVFVFVSALLIAGLDYAFNQGYLYLLTLK